MNGSSICSAFMSFLRILKKPSNSRCFAPMRCHLFPAFCLVWMAPFLQALFRAWYFVRSSLVFGLLARRTWPLALMVSTNQVPFRTSNSKRSGQSSGCLGFGLTKFPHFIGLANSYCFVGLLNGSHFVGFIPCQHSPDHTGGFVGHGNGSYPAWLA